MRNLSTYLESLLDVDFDVKLTLGDICSFYPHMGGFASSESKLSLLSWKSDNFLKQFETVSPNNAWQRWMDSKSKSAIRLKHLKRDIRHGFILYLLSQPEDFKINQQNINKLIGDMNSLCESGKLRFEVYVDKLLSKEYEFKMWNKLDKGNTADGYMGSFRLIINA